VKVILQGVVGSRAYNLATPDSDEDRLGVYVEPATAFHGLHLPIDRAASKVTTDPDIQLHEARKYAMLALRCNPTILELMWLKEHEVREWSGLDLLYIRDCFLSAQRVREAYLGYATSQFQRLLTKGRFASKMRLREEKHARHLLRLLHQGYTLYSTGELPIWLEGPERFHDFGAAVAKDPDVAAQAMTKYEDLFDRAVSPLPLEPNPAAVESWLQTVRQRYSTSEDCA
jgi:predicted nucleotidyltransferase